MSQTPDNFCDKLGRQRTSHGHSKQPEDTKFLHQTYYFTYNKSSKRDKRKIRGRFQKIRRLSEYVWVLVAKSFTPTHIAGLGGFDLYLRAIRAWLETYPISKDEAEGAHAILQQLDSQRDEIIKEGENIRNKAPQRTISEDNSFPVKKGNTSTPYYINSRQQDPISININPGDSESAKGTQDFLSSIEQECSDAAGDPIYISSEDQLHNNLGGLFSKPLVWRSFTSRYPLPGDMPTSIPDFLAFLTHINVQSLEAIDYVKDAETPKNKTVAEIAQYFNSPPTTRSALNFLEMKNVFLPCVPVPVRQADLLRTAFLRKKGSVSRSVPNDNAMSPDREFLLLSGRNSVSPIHVDTAGQLTWIVGICGRKVWYVPSDLKLAANRLATGGSQFPEHYEGGWMRIIIEPGDLLIMPPGCPHAVFTPEDSFTAGGNFFTSSHLGTTITTTALQARYGYIFCNEKLSLQDYLDIALVLEQYQGLFSNEHLARVAASKVDWEAAEPLNADVEATHRDVAEDPASSPGGECRAAGGKGGSRKRGKSIKRQAPINNNSNEDRELAKKRMIWLQILEYIQQASAELEMRLTKGDS